MALLNTLLTWSDSALAYNDGSNTGTNFIADHAWYPVPSSLAWHPGPNGNPFARWTAGVGEAVTNTLRIQGTIAHADHNGDGIDFYVYVDGVQEYSKYIGTESTVYSFDLTGLSIGVGQNVDFVVYKHGNYYNDSSLFSATISTVPEPSFIALLVTGLIGLLAYAWQKRRKN